MKNDQIKLTENMENEKIGKNGLNFQIKNLYKLITERLITREAHNS